MTASTEATREVPAGVSDGTLTVSTAGPDLLDSRRATLGLHRALRQLVGACRAERRALPLIPVVTVREGVVEAHLSAPLGPAPRPWRTRGHLWSVETAELPRSEETLDAYPGLVPLGRAGDRAVLVDLAAAPGLIEIAGAVSEVHEVLARIASGLLRAPWSRRVHITAVGLGGGRRGGDPGGDPGGASGEGPGGEPGATPGGDPRVRSVSGLADVLSGGPLDLGGVRGRWGAPPRGAHEVVLMARPADDVERRLVRQASRSRGAPTVIAPGVGHGVWQWRVESGVVMW
ncbi:hypothetical protein [Mobilicoccus caccae]|uniref:Type III secretion system (T3SS) SseB-like protein n=1 Tax=Mobilicoccus caccae TaxID=1859295 RepID=A0ABQ6IU63_9MICO|nr:hypothetical protein [Mobilicoccus caccae]GMA41483.1 hypothetical protein GCM10025883_35280 [Mobilicoccus caccae]